MAAWKLDDAKAAAFMISSAPLVWVRVATPEKMLSRLPDLSGGRRSPAVWQRSEGGAGRVMGLVWGSHQARGWWQAILKGPGQRSRRGGEQAWEGGPRQHSGSLVIYGVGS